MIKYRAVVNGNITKENVAKETKNFMCLEADKKWFSVGTRKESKESDTHKYFDSFEEAKEWAIKKLDIRISCYQEAINRDLALREKAMNRSESDCRSYHGK